MVWTRGLALLMLSVGAYSQMIQSATIHKPFELGSVYEMECDCGANNDNSTAVYFVRTRAYLAPFKGSSSEISTQGGFILSRGATISPLFAETLRDSGKGERYTFTETDAATGGVRMVISDLQPEDTGEVGCIVASSTNMSDNVRSKRLTHITVEGAPTSVEWFTENADGVTTNITHVDVTERELVDVVCRVAFPTVVPRVSVLLTGPGGAGGDDLTPGFSLKPCCKTISTTHHGYWTHAHWVAVVPRRAVRARPDMDGREMVCRTSIMRWEQQTTDNVTSLVQTSTSLVATLRLNVTYAPRISCAPTGATGGAADAVVVCRVYSNPYADITYTSHHSDSSQHATRLRLRDRGDHVEAQLTADDTGSYTLVARNSVGTSSAPIRLTAPTVESMAARSCVSVLHMWTLVSMATYFIWS